MKQQRTELIQHRKGMDLTQDELAELANISRPYYANIEAGRKDPSIGVAKRIADALHTTVDSIFFNSIVPKGNTA